MITISQLKIKLKASFIAAIAMSGLFSVLSGESLASPQASFVANQTSGCTPLSVSFTNTSTGAVSYYWDLGNGNTSTLQDPVNLYTNSGSYTITLIATDALGQTDTAVYSNYINAIGKPAADFNCAVTSSCLDDNLFSFINTSSGGLNYL